MKFFDCYDKSAQTYTAELHKVDGVNHYTVKAVVTTAATVIRGFINGVQNVEFRTSVPHGNIRPSMEQAMRDLCE